MFTAVFSYGFLSALVHSHYLVLTSVRGSHIQHYLVLLGSLLKMSEAMFFLRNFQEALFKVTFMNLNQVSLTICLNQRVTIFLFS